MPVKIRLQRRGRKKQPFYHIVVADSRAPRDGRFIEKLGTYNPMTKPATIEIDRDRAFEWLMNGAQPTDTTRAILRFKGVLYKKHLQRGVQKGALTQEEADQKLQAWIDDKEARVATRREKTDREQAEFLAMINGTPPPPPKQEEEVTQTKDIPAVEVAEEAPAEEVKAEEAPAEEVKAEEVKAEEAKAEEAPAEEVKAEEAPAEEVKAEEAPAEEVKAEEAPAEEVKAEEPEPAATEETKK